jgi:hypothetical protein
MTRLVKTLTALMLAVTTFAASPAFARIASNGVALNGIESNGIQGVAGQASAADSQALRVNGIELPR